MNIDTNNTDIFTIEPIPTMTSLLEIFETLTGYDAIFRYNKTLEETISVILKFNDSVVLLNDTIDKLNSSLLLVGSRSEANTNKSISSSSGETQYPTFYSALPEVKEKERSFLEEAKGYTETAKSIAKAAKGGVELAEALGYAEKVRGIKAVVKGLSAVADVAAGAEKLAAAAETLEVIAAGGEIMAGAETVATALSTFGALPGVIAGIVTLAGGFAAAQILKNSEPVKKVETDPLAEGVKNRNPAILNILQGNDNAVKIAEIVSRKDDRELKKEQKERVSSMLKNGGNILFDSERAAKDRTYIPAIVEAIVKSDRMPNHPIKGIHFDNKREMEVYGKYIDPLGTFPKAVLPTIMTEYTQTIGVMNKKRKEYLSPKEYDRKYHPKPIGLKIVEDLENQMLISMIQGYQRRDDKYVSGYVADMHEKNKNNPTYLASEKRVLAKYEKAKKFIDQSKNGKSSSGAYSQQGNSNVDGKTIIINLNKSMIEHFTVNTKEIKEGMNEFKHKVEEVLLEILNSVNTH